MADSRNEVVSEKAIVRDAGGGIIELVIDRGANQYPPKYADVMLVWSQPPAPEDRQLPDPAEPGITVEERIRRIGMEGNHWLHPDYTDRELRMLDDLGSLVGWAYDVMPTLRRGGVTFPLMPDLLKRIATEYGSWIEG